MENGRRILYCICIYFSDLYFNNSLNDSLNEGEHANDAVPLLQFAVICSGKMVTFCEWLVNKLNVKLLGWSAVLLFNP
jgi:hypothetical protein